VKEKDSDMNKNNKNGREKENRQEPRKKKNRRRKKKVEADALRGVVGGKQEVGPVGSDGADYDNDLLIRGSRSIPTELRR
jgi:hypothetical protein